jgi:twitching motility protein PilT
MQTLNQSLATLYHKRLISIEMAMQRSSNPDELRELIEHGAGVNTGNGGAPGAQQRPHASPYSQPRPVGVRPNVR